MAEKLEDLNLPVAVVTRIIKEALPEGCNVAKEAKLALSKAASVFVLYLTSHANKIAIENGKKTITNKDVMEAIQDTEFGRFEEQLKEAAEQYRKLQNSKKEASINKKKAKDQNQDEDNEEELEGDVWKSCIVPKMGAFKVKPFNPENNVGIVPK